MCRRLDGISVDVSQVSITSVHAGSVVVQSAVHYTSVDLSAGSRPDEAFLGLLEAADGPHAVFSDSSFFQAYAASTSFSSITTELTYPGTDPPTITSANGTALPEPLPVPSD
eukprot:gene19656-23512_t